MESSCKIAQFRGKIGRFGDLTAQTAIGIMNPGYFLNPRFHYQEGFEFSDNIRSGVTKVIERLAPNVTFAIEATREDTRETCIQAWYMDDSEEDQRLPHHRDPPEFLSLEQLEELGVLSWHLDADNYETDEELKKIRENRGYTYSDMINCCPEKLPNYEAKIKSFFEEHIHTDEEIRYCLDGSGYFDVRDQNDRWIRVWVKKGAMIVLPAGIYHRFTMDTDNYIKAMRLFVGEPVWTPYNRPQDDHPVRKEYIETFLKKQDSGPAVEAH